MRVAALLEEYPARIAVAQPPVYTWRSALTSRSPQLFDARERLVRGLHAPRDPCRAADGCAHRQRADPVRGVSQRTVVAQPAERGQDRLPVVPFDLRAGEPAE